MILQNIPVERWGLSTATENALLAAGVRNYVDFIKGYLATEKTLKQIPGIGDCRMWEIEGRLDDLGLRRTLTTAEKIVLYFARPWERPKLAVDLISRTQAGKDRLSALDEALDSLSNDEKEILILKFSSQVFTDFRSDYSVYRAHQLERKALRKMRCLLKSSADESICVEMLDFSSRAFNILKRNDINTIDDIMATDFTNIYGIGACTEREIIDKIAQLGYQKKPVLHY